MPSAEEAQDYLEAMHGIFADVKRRLTGSAGSAAR